MLNIKLKKLLISIFAVLNVCTIFFMSRPDQFIASSNKYINSNFSPQNVYNIGLFAWYIKRYAHLVGLDNCWKMFGHQSRFNWWYVIKARYPDEEIKLPLPMQSKRTFLEWLLFDFKEAKFYLNIYGSKDSREIYSHYLCRKYRSYKDKPISSIIFELHHQYILPPEQARQKGYCLDPNSYSRVLDEFICPG